MLLGYRCGITRSFFFLKGGQTVDLSRLAETAHKNRNKSLKNIIHENEIEETYNINDAFSIFVYYKNQLK